MSELLFEAYNVPSVAYGVDALFGAHRSAVQQLGKPLEEAVVVSCGHGTVHILPVVAGRLDAAHCKRSATFVRRSYQIILAVLTTRVLPTPGLMSAGRTWWRT